MRRLVVLISATASVALPLLVLASPRAGLPVLVVAAPWSSPAATAAVVAEAGGSLLRGTPLSWIVVARADEAGFSGRLRRAGAWITLDASRIPGCPSTAPA